MTRHALGLGLVLPKWRTTSMSQWVFRKVVASGRWGTRASGTLLLWGLVGFGTACSSDENPPADPAPLPLPTGEVNVEVSYPNAAAESVTSPSFTARNCGASISASLAANPTISAKSHRRLIRRGIPPES